MTVPIQITRYKVTCWLDKVRCEPVYGVKVLVVGTGWADVSEDGEPVFRRERKDAEAYIAHMKKERDKSGYKITKAA